jgi:hypothetical protein
LSEARAELDQLIDEEVRKWARREGEDRSPPVGRTPRRARSEACSPVPETETREAGDAAGDPLRRLDELARRLDGRLRQGRVAKPEAGTREEAG